MMERGGIKLCILCRMGGWVWFGGIEIMWGGRVGLEGV